MCARKIESTFEQLTSSSAASKTKYIFTYSNNKNLTIIICEVKESKTRVNIGVLEDVFPEETSKDFVRTCRRWVGKSYYIFFNINTNNEQLTTIGNEYQSTTFEELFGLINSWLNSKDNSVTVEHTHTTKPVLDTFSLDEESNWPVCDCDTSNEITRLIIESCKLMAFDSNNSFDASLFLKMPSYYKHTDDSVVISDKYRLSEQEFKQLFIYVFSKNISNLKCDYKLSVETPTVNDYKFSGSIIDSSCVLLNSIEINSSNNDDTDIEEEDSTDVDIQVEPSADELDNTNKKSGYTSARVDLSLYTDGTINHFEFKAHNTAFKNIAKDFLKLYCEPSLKESACNHYFLHVIDSFTSGTALSLLSKFIEAVKLKKLTINGEKVESKNSIDIYVCVLKNKLIQTNSVSVYHFSDEYLIQISEMIKQCIKSDKSFSDIATDIKDPYRKYAFYISRNIWQNCKVEF
ncbi:MAG: hypothetical protein IJM59_14285 [Proteobacteria bacterium]|nr:hypothetical protein [Pseudomonadota bacterium]